MRLVSTTLGCAGADELCCYRSPAMHREGVADEEGQRCLRPITDSTEVVTLVCNCSEPRWMCAGCALTSICDRSPRPNPKCPVSPLGRLAHDERCARRPAPSLPPFCSWLTLIVPTPTAPPGTCLPWCLPALAQRCSGEVTGCELHRTTHEKLPRTRTSRSAGAATAAAADKHIPVVSRSNLVYRTVGRTAAAFIDASVRAKNGLAQSGTGIAADCPWATVFVVGAGEPVSHHSTAQKRYLSVAGTLRTGTPYDKAFLDAAVVVMALASAGVVDPEANAGPSADPEDPMPWGCEERLMQEVTAPTNASGTRKLMRAILFGDTGEPAALPDDPNAAQIKRALAPIATADVAMRCRNRNCVGPTHKTLSHRLQQCGAPTSLRELLCDLGIAMSSYYQTRRECRRDMDATFKGPVRDIDPGEAFIGKGVFDNYLLNSPSARMNQRHNDPSSKKKLHTDCAIVAIEIIGKPAVVHLLDMDNTHKTRDEVVAELPTDGSGFLPTTADYQLSTELRVQMQDRVATTLDKVEAKFPDVAAQEDSLAFWTAPEVVAHVPESDLTVPRRLTAVTPPGAPTAWGLADAAAPSSPLEEGYEDPTPKVLNCYFPTVDEEHPDKLGPGPGHREATGPVESGCAQW